MYTQVCTGIIKSHQSDEAKYANMTAILDGTIGISQVDEQLDDFADVKTRLRSIQQHIRSISRQSPLVCKVCTTICREPTIHQGHGSAGCPRVLNKCFKCFGRHAKGVCTDPLFKVAPKYCWKCWMPLAEFFGISFHSSDIGPNCDNAALDYVKQLLLAYFYDRDLATMECPASTLIEYQDWLFKDSGISVSGSGQVPNMLLLLESFILRFEV